MTTPIDKMDKMVNEFQKVLDDKNNTDQLIRRKMMEIILSSDEGMVNSVAFKLHFMYGYHVGLTREEVYKKWVTKEYFH